MKYPALPVDELFAKLKAHDPNLQSVLQQRWDDFKASQNPTSTPTTPLSGSIKSASLQSGSRRYSPSFPFERQHVPLETSELVGPWDVTAPNLRAEHVVSDHIKWVRQYDWSSTPLGPMSSWSRPLRQAANHVLVDPRAAVIWWGPQRICICMQKLQSNVGDDDISDQ
nr:hypothetical protein CFP56_10381 [Quercus suber]